MYCISSSLRLSSSTSPGGFAKRPSSEALRGSSVSTLFLTATDSCRGGQLDRALSQRVVGELCDEHRRERRLGEL